MVVSCESLEVINSMDWCNKRFSVVGFLSVINGIEIGEIKS